MLNGILEQKVLFDCARQAKGASNNKGLVQEHITCHVHCE